MLLWYNRYYHRLGYFFVRRSLTADIKLGLYVTRFLFVCDREKEKKQHIEARFLLRLKCQNLKYKAIFYPICCLIIVGSAIVLTAAFVTFVYVTTVAS